jgi:deoxyribonuclease V
VIAAVKPYRPGAFYERELPCITAVLARVRTPLRAVVVDGYVELDDRGSPGLGAHLHAHLGGAVAVVGVAKTAFRGAAFARAVLRGASRTPLFVTSRGIDVADAARLVQQMHGPHRIPTLLARADRLARGFAAPTTIDEALVAGARLFDAGAFFEAHEAWEDRWRVETDASSRRFLQGLIQVAAAFHKLVVTKSPESASRLLERGLAKLDACPAAIAACNLTPFVEALHAFARALAAGSVDAARIPRMGSTIPP